jgi:hypothetical protein
MTEREIAEAYRRRFSEQRDATEALNRLYEGACVGLKNHHRVWGVAVARPRIPLSAPAGFTRDDTRALLAVAGREAAGMLRREEVHPLDSVNRNGVRPGLRRWIAPTLNHRPEIRAQASLHQDGAITLAAALGDHRVDEGTFASWRMEGLVADTLCFLKAAASRTGSVEYEVRVGLAPWSLKVTPRMIAPNFDYGLPYDHTEFIDVYDPVDATISLDTGFVGLLDQARQLTLDCINQGGIDELMLLRNAV